MASCQESPLPLGTSLPATALPSYPPLCDGSSWVGSWLLLSWHADTPLSWPLPFCSGVLLLGVSDHTWVEGTPAPE